MRYDRARRREGWGLEYITLKWHSAEMVVANELEGLSRFHLNLDLAVGFPR
jgi:hypothetical protein